MAKRGAKSAWEYKIKPRLKEIEGWCREGLYYQEMSNRLGIHLATFMKYKAEKPEFDEILKKGREVVDLQVENALLKRALGFEYEEETNEGFTDENGDIVRGHKKIVKKRVLPDPVSMIFWLKNRQGHKWHDRKNYELTGRNQGPIELKLNKAEFKELMDELIAEDDS